MLKRPIARPRAGSAGAARRGQDAGRSGDRQGPGWLWLLLAPLACCGLPLLAAGLAAAGTLAWGGLGLALAVALAIAAQYVRHHSGPAAARRPGPDGHSGKCPRLWQRGRMSPATGYLPASRQARRVAGIRRIVMPTGIGRDGLRTLISQQAQLIEVLPADEYDWAHLPGAVSLPLKELDARTGQLDRSRPVIVYCHDSL